MQTSIVIPTWRGRHLLEAYLPSVLAACAAEQFETEIVVVEDAGGDDTTPWLRSRFGDRVRAFAHDRNRGFCAACRTGFLQARFPVVLLLNNDVRLEPGCIRPLAEHFADPDVFAVTGKLYNQKGDVFCNGGKVARFRRGMWTSWQNYDALDSGTGPFLSFAAVGAFSAYDRAKFLAIGGFDPLTAMFEDVEISYRAWKRGWLVRYEPRAVAYHDASQTMRRRYRKRSLEMLARRSRIVMHWILLDDRGMFARHVASIAGRLLASWVWLDWPFYWAVLSSLGQIAAIRRRRKENRRAAVRSDRDLVKLLEEFYRTAPIALRNS